VSGGAERLPASHDPKDLAMLVLSRQRDESIMIGDNIGKTLTLNLKAPIVINLETRTGRQVVASGELPLQYELSQERPPLKKSA
jgi:flagellar assembly factor FliW